MKDCIGNDLAVGDLAMEIPWSYRSEDSAGGEVVKIQKIVPRTAIENFSSNCGRCGAADVVDTVDDSFCGCILLKISPDANQFEHEKELVSCK